MFFGISRQAVTLAGRGKEVYLVGLGDRRKLCMVSYLSYLWDLEEQKGGVDTLKSSFWMACHKGRTQSHNTDILIFFDSYSVL